MLNDAVCFDKIFIKYGYTDLRLGIDGLSSLIQREFHMDPFTPRCLFLFCGRRSDRFKGLVWEEDGFCLVYKRAESGSYQWPRSAEEVNEISLEQYKWLMQGLTLVPKKKVNKIQPHSAN